MLNKIRLRYLDSMPITRRRPKVILQICLINDSTIPECLMMSIYISLLRLHEMTGLNLFRREESS